MAKLLNTQNLGTFTANGLKLYITTVDQVSRYYFYSGKVDNNKHKVIDKNTKETYFIINDSDTIKITDETEENTKIVSQIKNDPTSEEISFAQLSDCIQNQIYIQDTLDGSINIKGKVKIGENSNRRDSLEILSPKTTIRSDTTFLNGKTLRFKRDKFNDGKEDGSYFEIQQNSSSSEDNQNILSLVKKSSTGTNTNDAIFETNFITIDNNASIGGLLNVTGATTLKNDLSIKNGETTNFEVQASTGNTNIKGVLDLDNNLDVDGSIITLDGTTSTTITSPTITIQSAASSAKAKIEVKNANDGSIDLTSNKTTTVTSPTTTIQSESSMGTGTSKKIKTKKILVDNTTEGINLSYTEITGETNPTTKTNSVVVNSDGTTITSGTNSLDVNRTEIDINGYLVVDGAGEITDGLKVKNVFVLADSTDTNKLVIDNSGSLNTTGAISINNTTGFISKSNGSQFIGPVLEIPKIDHEKIKMIYTDWTETDGVVYQALNVPGGLVLDEGTIKVDWDPDNKKGTLIDSDDSSYGAITTHGSVTINDTNDSKGSLKIGSNLTLTDGVISGEVLNLTGNANISGTLTVSEGTTNVTLNGSELKGKLTVNGTTSVSGANLQAFKVSSGETEVTTGGATLRNTLTISGTTSATSANLQAFKVSSGETNVTTGGANLATGTIASGSYGLSVSGTTSATSANLQAFKVSSGETNVTTGGSELKGKLTVTGSTSATSANLQAFKVSSGETNVTTGGSELKGKLTVSGTTDVTGNASFTNSNNTALSVSGVTTVTSTSTDVNSPAFTTTTLEVSNKTTAANVDTVKLNITGSTTSTSAATGALTVTGGVGIGGNLNVDGAISGASVNAGSGNITTTGIISGGKLSIDGDKTTIDNGVITTTGNIYSNVYDDTKTNYWIVDENGYISPNNDAVKKGEIAIPKYIKKDNETKQIKGITFFAFEDCHELTSVTIPDSITSINDSVFYNCTKLKSVKIPNSVTSIGSSSFYNCVKLESLTIPNSVTSIGSGAFSYCSSLTSVIIPNSIKNIGENAFRDCNNLEIILNYNFKNHIPAGMPWGATNAKIKHYNPVLFEFDPNFRSLKFIFN